MSKETSLDEFARLVDDLPFVGPGMCDWTVENFVIPRIPQGKPLKIDRAMGLVRADEKVHVYTSHTVAVVGTGEVIGATLCPGQRVYKDLDDYLTRSPTWLVDD